MTTIKNHNSGTRAGSYFDASGRPPTSTPTAPLPNPDVAAAAAAVKATRRCRSFLQSGYCQHGHGCPFVDDALAMTPARVASNRSASTTMAEPFNTADVPRDRSQAVVNPPASRVVPKPVPQAQSLDPREFQLGQIRRRFTPKESRQAPSELGGREGGTLLQLKLTPSDPDFPFDITALECSLSVPNGYPTSKPRLRVSNKDIPRGFAANIESGFENLVAEMPNATLLELMKSLDRSLEVFLSAPKVETVTIVPNKDTRHLSQLSSRSVGPVMQTKREAENSTSPSSPEPRSKATKQVKTFTAEQKAGAAKARDVETRQLETRMGRLPLYKKFHDGIAYTVPIEPRKTGELPSALRGIKVVQMFVPPLYPLEPCRIKLDGVCPADAEPVEKGFEMRAQEQTQNTLMGHINYLAQNMHILAKTKARSQDTIAAESISQDAASTQSTTVSVSEPKAKVTGGDGQHDNSHIQYITRPVEWTIVDHKETTGLDSETDDSYSYDTDESSSSTEGGCEINDDNNNQSSQAPHLNPERGTAISFPFIELHGIELLEVVVLNITVKCERCKDVMPMTGLKDGVAKMENCKKCATPLTVTYRRELVHAHSVRAGFLDMEGCSVVDMLPSTFLPTCSNCSTPYPLPGIISIRAESTRNVCRHCHSTFTFLLPAIKFLRITASTHLPSTAIPRRKKADLLGLTPGTPLPRRGRCKHYTKSYRWFRFSCCQHVYPCDRCHDETEEHAHEWANRMICGLV